MKVDIELERSIVVPLPPEKVRVLFDDIHATISRFPKLKKLTRLGDDRYLWELNTVGSRLANIAYSVTYGAHYVRSKDGNELSWVPLPDKGNASISGSFRILEHKAGSEIRFKVKGELRDVPVPLIYRLVAPAFIQGKFIHMVEVFLQTTHDALLTQPPASSSKKKSSR